MRKTRPYHTALSWFAVLATIVVVAGCATPRQAFNQAAHPNVKKVALVRPPLVDQYAISIVYHPGASFGLIGGLIAAGELSSKGTQLTTIVKSTQFDFGAELAIAVEEALRAQGRFELSFVGTDEMRKDYLADYKSLGGACDAYLDFVPLVAGYSATSHSTPYYPWAAVKARLIDSRTAEVLYLQTIVYSNAKVGEGVVKLEPSASLGFENMDALSADRPRAAEGLRTAAKAVARQIASDL